MIVLALFLSGCVALDNRPSIEALERAAVLAPQAELDARIQRVRPYLPVGSLSPVRLPMLPGDVPIVQGSINGVAMPFLLDTGTSNVVVSGPAAAAIGLYLPAGKATSLVTPGYDARFRTAAPRTLSLGDMRFSGGIAIVPERENSHMRRLGLIDAKKAQRHSRKAFTAGSALFTLVHLQRLQLHGREFPGLSAQVVNLVDGAVSGGLPRAGLLGFAALGPHRWVVDYPKRRLIPLRPLRFYLLKIRCGAESSTAMSERRG